MAAIQSSRIIVLNLTKYGDSSLVVHCIDSACGRCSYMLRGVGRSKRVTMGSLHNLAILDIVSVANPRSSMSLIKEYEPAVHLSSLRSDMDKNAIAMFISELLYRTIVGQNNDERLFSWLCSAITLLDAAGKDEDIAKPSGTNIANFHLWFLAGFCTVMGFGPTREGLFDGCDLLQSARFDNLALLRQFAAAEFPDAMAIPLTGARRRDFCERMIRYISYHLGINLNLRSLDVLHELYQ
ncbi:MAG: DNA repair protein RecO C-terminal domain-containing protein [Bacteroidales bacterium]|nr:DNA repair protein RecO C-terminal domain-containing protein [Bacteroidales bacterium]